MGTKIVSEQPLPKRQNGDTRYRYCMIPVSDHIHTGAMSRCHACQAAMSRCRRTSGEQRITTGMLEGSPRAARAGPIFFMLATTVCGPVGGIPPQGPGGQLAVSLAGQDPRATARPAFARGETATVTTLALQRILSHTCSWARLADSPSRHAARAVMRSLSHCAQCTR